MQFLKDGVQTVDIKASQRNVSLLEIYHYGVFRMAGRVKTITGPEEEFSTAKPEDSHSEQHRLSWCDLCYEESGNKLKVEGFCQECNCFLCRPCADAHKKSPASKTHVILRGARMPKSQDDKPVKYTSCTKHIGKVNDHFCLDHAEMICSRCNETIHLYATQNPSQIYAKSLHRKMLITLNTTSFICINRLQRPNQISKTTLPIWTYKESRS